MTRWLLVVPFLISFACTPEDRCSSHDDCWDSHAVQEAGKCAPEAWCEEGICRFPGFSYFTETHPPT